VEGFYVTNSTWAALSMENGDEYAKKFGGETGDDQDWFRLSVWGYLNGAVTDTVHFYLADYRFENNEEDYIVKTWEWVDLSMLGKVDSLLFDLASADVGDFGINTPAYFCIDNLAVWPHDLGNEELTMETSDIHLYPNPATDAIRIDLDDNETAIVTIHDLQGRALFIDEVYASMGEIDLSEYSRGFYIVSIHIEGNIDTFKFIKE
jgi:hypothetical protein